VVYFTVTIPFLQIKKMAGQQKKLNQAAVLF
jgi:hypothetical protein